MQKSVISLIVGVFLLLFQGCGSSNLSYSRQQIHLEIDDVFTQIEGKILQKKYDSYGSLFIEQKILRLKDGDIVVYENARTDLQYEFEKSIAETVKVVFDAKRTYIIYAKNNLFAYQLLLEDGNILNVIAQQDDSQQLKMLYGMSSRELNKILKALDSEAKPAYYKKTIKIVKPQNAIKSRWNVQKVHFYPLVSPLPRMMML